jgi:hypothetical protein
VARKKHTLGRSQLTVSLEEPPKPMKDRVLVKGLPNKGDFTVKELSTFLKKIFHQDVKDILFCDEESDEDSEEMALVCFEEDIGGKFVFFIVWYSLIFLS